MLPAVTVGTSRLVEREALASFLERVGEAEDTSSLIEQVRQEKAAPSRRSLRTLVRRDTEPASLTVIPEGMSLDRGRLEISFRNLEQLAESLVYLARLLDGDLDGFAQAYEPEAPLPAETDEAPREVGAMFKEMEQMEAERAPTR